MTEEQQKQMEKDRERIKLLHRQKANTVVGCIPEGVFSQANIDMFRDLVSNMMTSAHLEGFGEGVNYVLKKSLEE